MYNSFVPIWKGRLIEMKTQAHFKHLNPRHNLCPFSFISDFCLFASLRGQAPQVKGRKAGLKRSISFIFCRMEKKWGNLLSSHMMRVRPVIKEKFSALWENWRIASFFHLKGKSSFDEKKAPLCLSGCRCVRRCVGFCFSLSVDRRVISAERDEFLVSKTCYVLCKARKRTSDSVFPFGWHREIVPLP